MDDTRTMAQLLEAPTVGYEDAIVVPEITADNFELKHDHFYDEVPERPEYVGKAYAFPIFPRGFQQRFDETFYEAWDRFNDLLWACPHHGFSKLHQLDTFYNALNSNDQDSLNSAAGGNFLDKMPRDCLRIIERKSKVRNSRNKPVVAKVSSSSSTPGISPDVVELKDMVKALLLEKKNQTQAPAPVKTVEESCVTCGGAHSYGNCPATGQFLTTRDTVLSGWEKMQKEYNCHPPVSLDEMLLYYKGREDKLRLIAVWLGYRRIKESEEEHAQTSVYRILCVQKKKASTRVLTGLQMILTVQHEHKCRLMDQTLDDITERFYRALIYSGSKLNYSNQQSIPSGFQSSVRSDSIMECVLHSFVIDSMVNWSDPCCREKRLVRIEEGIWMMAGLHADIGDTDVSKAAVRLV
ncbi:hypothetical protein Tco_0273167 [Tanacetum coccineum]